MSNITKLEPRGHSSSNINPIVAVTVKDVYGQRMVYPANTQAELFASISGRKTFTVYLLEQIIAMGFRVVAVYPTGETPVSDVAKLFQAPATERACKRHYDGFRGWTN